MQTFRDSATGKVWQFDDDVKALAMNGIYAFTTAAGVKLTTPSTLQPYTAAAPTAAQLLAQAQATQSAALTAACGAAIVAGFQSSALGSAHTYPSQPNDQTNLIGAVTASQSPGLPATWACNFWCADSTGAWAFRSHTATQIQQVLADAVVAREAFSAKLAGLVAQVNDATTVAEVQAVAWS